VNRYRSGLVALLAVVGVALAVFILRQPADLSAAGPGAAANPGLIDAASRPPAADFTGTDGWLNSRPLTIGGLRGKVVLIDFWTYSCINCLRTFPHLQALESDYASKGLVIVGVHSPEFDFEKNPGNVAAAVKREKVTWPVCLDSEMATWNAWQNNVWPAEYLVDPQGRVAFAHLGEGDYERTAAAVASLLSAPAPSASPAPSGGGDTGGLTPELYAGSSRGQLADGEQYGQPDWTFRDPGPPQQNDAIQLAGDWHDTGQYVEARSSSLIRLRFQASQVFIVAASSDGGRLVAQATVDGRPLASAARGADLGPRGIAVSGARLYRLAQSQPPGHHLLELRVPAGFRLYTFTFG
jgi:thiol-disulfide isomerase/thioredoxin